MVVLVEERESVEEESFVGQGEQGSVGLVRSTLFSGCCGTSSATWSPL